LSETCKRCGVKWPPLPPGFSGLEIGIDGYCTICAEFVKVYGDVDFQQAKAGNGGESIPNLLIYNNECRGQQVKTGREVELENFVRQFLKATMNVGDYGVAECHQRAKELGF
jgi:hypothetical protein